MFMSTCTGILVDTRRRTTSGYYTEDDLWIVEVVQVEPLPKTVFEHATDPRDDTTLLRSQCLNCLKGGAAGSCMQCGKCKGALFCSVDCQKAVWKYHKDMCKAVTAFRELRAAEATTIPTAAAASTSAGEVVSEQN